jgi:ribosomal peptide maturation radical SAM protein 1
MLPFRSSGDLLLICPPFASIRRPSLGLHLLKEIASEETLDSDIYYANLHLAKDFGELAYLVVAQNAPFLGERIFSPFAFPGMAFGDRLYTEGPVTLGPAQSRHGILQQVDIAACSAELEATVRVWLDTFRQLVRGLGFRVFGFSSTFAQNLASATMAKIIKEERPDSLVIVGGANCDGDLATGVASLTDAFDYVFVGEADSTFRHFCRNLAKNQLPSDRFVRGAPIIDLEASPLPDYHAFFAQYSFFLPDSELHAKRDMALPYETSRGCWWGQKHHCTFCGLNGNGMAFRRKTGEKIFNELRVLRERHGKLLIAMADNIMPMQNFHDLLPQLAQEAVDLNIFYEVKANLNRQQLKCLKAAGVILIQPGIEAFSTALLRRMRKGVSAAQNIRLLRHCRSLGIFVLWNLLYDFPGDSDADYAETLSLLPKLRHMEPPEWFAPVSYDRFSPYFTEAESLGIRSLRPAQWYYEIYPPHVSIDNLAYYFVGDADVVSRRNPALVNDILAEVRTWVEAWRRPEKPLLRVTLLPNGEYIVYDTRSGVSPKADVVTAEMAAIITGEARQESPEVCEAMRRDWVIDVDGSYLGLAVAPEDVIETLAPTRAREDGAAAQGRALRQHEAETRRVAVGGH